MARFILVPMTTIFIKRTFIVLIYLASAISALRSFYATCSKGLEPLLKAEVANLRGVEAVKQASSGVFFEGDDTTGFDALLHVRTALRLMENLAPGAPTGAVRRRAARERALGGGAEACGS